MLNEIITVKRRGYRYYEVSNDFIEYLNERYFKYHIYSDILVRPIIEIGYKDEKKLKEIYKKYSEEKTLEKLNEKIIDFNNGIQVDNNYKDKNHLSYNRIGLITGSNTPFDKNGKPIYTFDKYVATKVMEQFIASTVKTDNLLQLEVLRTNNDEANLILNENHRSGNELMQRGNELESEAMELALNVLPMRREPMIDIFYYNRAYKIGATPDGVFIDNEGNKCVIEIKSPALNTFIQHISEKHLVKEYYQQLQVEMLLTGARKAYLVVYYPNFNLIVDEVARDDIFIANAMDTIQLFNEKFDKYLQNILEQYKGITQI